MTQFVVVNYSDDGMWGSEPVPPNVDIPASYARFESQIRTAVLDGFPGANVELIHGLDDRHSINGMTDHEDTCWLGEIIHRVWSSFNWVIYQ